MTASNLTLSLASARADLLDVTSYRVELDLTDGGGRPGTRTFRSRTTVRFACRRPGEQTFVDLVAETISSATLDGRPLDVSGYDPGSGLVLPDLAADNTLVVEADCLYMNTGEGLHRFVDPVDDEVYLYSQFETADAKRMYACFDQPDLKAAFTLDVTAPAHWTVVSTMPVERTEPAGGGAVRSVFATTPRISTYVTALVAGPYAEVRRTHDGIDLGVLCRASLAEHLDADDVFTLTAQGFDYFHRVFGYRYPLPKYDQCFVPEFNAGAMENFGCVTFLEDYIFRSKVTDFEYEQRANTILHEMAHMWFGDLVTMRWWDDLWLNESFAEWASHLANTEATRYTDAWTTFATLRKTWAYRQDQLSSTHPVYCEIPDVEAVEVNFDGITYAKGASVLKQLVAYVGREAFFAGLQAYFRRHEYGNTTFSDLLAALEESSGRQLGEWAAQWLETSQVNTLRPEYTLADDGSFSSFAVLQSAPPEHPVLRTHRLAIGLYDLEPAGAEGAPVLRRRDRVELDVGGQRTEVPQLVGARRPDVVLVNDDDLTYCKVRLDPHSLTTLTEHLAAFQDSLPRALCWAAAWDMTRDAEMPARDFVRLALAGVPAERDIGVVTVVLRQVRLALAAYADPAWAPEGWRLLADRAEEVARASEPGSDAQLTWVRTLAAAARDEHRLATVRGLLDGSVVLDGLRVDTDLRWALLQSLVAHGGADAGAIEAEAAGARPAAGQREAATARALVPTAAAKAEAWRLATEDDDLPNAMQEAVIAGFSHPAQVELLAPYVERYFEVVGKVWARRSSEIAQYVAVGLYPSWAVSAGTLAATDAWLAGGDSPPALRRLVQEGRDGVVRALRARARDSAA